MKTKFNLNDDLPLELYSTTILVRAIFHESNKNYPQVFLD